MNQCTIAVMLTSISAAKRRETETKKRKKENDRMSEQERVYHTPPEVLVDAVLGNPPLGGITDTPDEAKPTGGAINA